jgi:hypothetical protein
VLEEGLHLRTVEFGERNLQLGTKYLLHMPLKVKALLPELACLDGARFRSSPHLSSMSHAGRVSCIAIVLHKDTENIACMLVG